MLPASNQLAILSGMSFLPQFRRIKNQADIILDTAVTLFALPDFAKAGITNLPQARYAQVFATTTYTLPAPKHTADSSTSVNLADATQTKDLLVIGCRKKVVVYGAGKGGMKDAWVSSPSRRGLA